MDSRIFNVGSTRREHYNHAGPRQSWLGHGVAVTHCYRHSACDLQLWYCPLRGAGAGTWRADRATGAATCQVGAARAQPWCWWFERRPEGRCGGRHTDHVVEEEAAWNCPIAARDIRWLITRRPTGAGAWVERRGCQVDRGSWVIRQGNTAQLGVAVVAHLPADAHFDHHLVADVHQRRARDALFGDADFGVHVALALRSSCICNGLSSTRRGCSLCQCLVREHEGGGDKCG